MAKQKKKTNRKGGGAGVRLKEQRGRRKANTEKRGMRREEKGTTEVGRKLRVTKAGVGDVLTQLWVKERSLSRGFSIELRVSVVLCHSYSPIKP